MGNANAEENPTIIAMACATNNWCGAIEEEKVEEHGKLTIKSRMEETD